MGKSIKITGLLLGIFFLSVILVNILMPAFQHEISEEYVGQHARTIYESEEPGSERILCIDDNEEAFLWRLRMIGNAKESIVLATFDLRDDVCGTDIMAALLHAAERGVKVKLLVDGIYQPIFLQHSDTFHALCAHENVEARYYNPINLQGIYKVNYRMHDKYLMIDDKMYLLGGRNTTDTFLGDEHDGSNVDRDILVYHTMPGRGESFGQLQEYFTKIWEETCVRKVKKIPKQTVIDKEQRKLQDRYKKLVSQKENFEQYDNWMEDTFEADRITLITNGTHAGNKEPRVLYTIGELAKKGTDVMIQTPYVICNDAMYGTLQKISENARLDILLNAVEKGSNPWGCTDFLNNKKNILNTGANTYELLNEYAVHTKAVLVDENLSIVGSYNLDMRSTYLDTELMLVIDSEYLNSHIREMVEEYKKKSVETLCGGSKTQGTDYVKQEMDGVKKVVYQVLRIIIRPFRHML